MFDGFVPLPRKYFQDHWLRDSNEAFSLWEAWTDLWYLANYQNRKRYIKGRLVTVQRGQVAASLRFLAKRWRWTSDSKVRKLLELLEKDELIERDTAQGITVVTICEYEHYSKNQSYSHTLEAQTERLPHATQTHPTRRKSANKKKGNKGVKRSKKEGGVN